jgi:site-specific DNA-methyltransferase (adenine-specific)
MEYLIRLVTPPKGLVLDPFAGSGSTLLAADRLGFASIGIEKEPHYYDLILSRVTGAAYEP